MAEKVHVLGGDAPCGLGGPHAEHEWIHEPHGMPVAFEYWCDGVVDSQ